ncbi:nucleoside triphosphate pyrophosphohydrolase family protein [soil metagenome]
MDEFATLTVAAYADRAARTDRGVDGQSLAFPILGLFGETGSLLSELKKKQRDSESYLGYSVAVAEELGDVLWYLSTIARRGGLKLSAIAAHGYRKDQMWRDLDDPTLTFEALQPHKIKRNGKPTPKFEATLLSLAGEVGALVADHQAGLLQIGGEALATRLVLVLSHLLRASKEAGQTLESAAIKNLHKTFDRWPDAPIYPPAFDDKSDPDEQLPRFLVVDLYEKKVRGQAYVFQRCNALFVGDRLTDNAHQPDDYRFHDVFHYAFVAILGWSPVVRALLRLKRKSEPAVDDAEDGARAILIEEGVSTWVFSQAKQLAFFANLKAGDLPLDMLKSIREFVTGYEPEACPLWLWEDAILQGYAAFRYLKAHRSGRVTIDFEKRQLRVEPLPT